MLLLLKRAVFTCFLLVLITLAVASVLDALTGCDGVARSVYGSVPFVVLWVLLALTALLYILWRQQWRQRATFLLHIAMLVILGGAFITHLYGRRGVVHLRCAERVSSFITADGAGGSLPFTLVLDSFYIVYDTATGAEKDYVSCLTIYDACAPRTHQVAMNKPLRYRGYRFCQADYSPEGCGSTLLVAHDPWGVGVTYTGYALLFVAMVLFFFQPGSNYRKIIHRKTIVYTLIIALLVAVSVAAVIRGMRVVPVLRSPLLPIHVSLIVIAYVLLTSITIVSIIALVRAKKHEGVALRRLCETLLTPAVFLLAIGVVVGALWANISWGRYWGWDAKEVWALITLMAYALPIHSASIAWFRNATHFHAYLIAAFLTVLMTYFGANYLLPGLHAYV